MYIYIIDLLFIHYLTLNICIFNKINKKYISFSNLNSFFFILINFIHNIVKSALKKCMNSNQRHFI